MLRYQALMCATTIGLCAQVSAAESAERPVIRFVYFIPTDRQPEPDYLERLDRVMTDVQRFYREGMEKNGYGKRVFELDRRDDGKLRFHEVRAKEPMRGYGRNSAQKVRQEVRQALRDKGIDIDRETIVIFQLLLAWKGKVAEEIGPYVGGGGTYSGTAWVFDDAKLDTRLLASRQPGGYYHGECSLGVFNTHYIGGVAHELGHALGLPHDCETQADHSRFGHSLMGAGNHSYGQELRNEGRGAFLSPASALPLSLHPLFTGKRLPPIPPASQITQLHPRFDAETIHLAGSFAGKTLPVGLVARNDPVERAGDYDAVGAACPVDAKGHFRLSLGDLRPGDYALRLEAYFKTGERQAYVFHYPVDSQRRPDLLPLREAVAIQNALTAFRKGDRRSLATMARDEVSTEPSAQRFRRKLEHLRNLLDPPAPVSLASIDASKSEVLLADVKPISASVGYGSLQINRVPQDGTNTFLLEVGGEFFESGLYAHAPARHSWQLDGAWRRLTTKYGLQDGRGGTVVFVIIGDGKELFRSAEVGDHVVREQTVDVSNIKRLELVTETGSDGASADWAVWLTPKLQRR